MGRPQKFSNRDFLELYNDNLLDVEIAEIIGVSNRTVRERRRTLGLPANERHCRTAWVFRVYDHETKEFVMEGTAREISKELYISMSLVRWYAKRTSAGERCRYDVYHQEV